MLKKIKSVLCIGAHPDDIELVCGATLLKLKDEHDAKIHLIICSRGELKSNGAMREKEQKLSAKMLGVDSCVFLNFPDGSIGNQKKELIKQIEKVVLIHKPDVVFTHSDMDHHQDHLAVFSASIAALRLSLSSILLYASVNYKRDKRVNVIVDVSNYFDKKIKILKCFESQDKVWYFETEFIRSLAVVAGRKYGFKYAEEFYLYSSIFK